MRKYYDDDDDYELIEDLDDLYEEVVDDYDDDDDEYDRNNDILVEFLPNVSDFILDMEDILTSDDKYDTDDIKGITLTTFNDDYESMGDYITGTVSMLGDDYSADTIKIRSVNLNQTKLDGLTKGLYEAIEEIDLPENIAVMTVTTHDGEKFPVLIFDFDDDKLLRIITMSMMRMKFPIYF